MEMDLIICLGRTIAEMRKIRGMSQIDFAKEVGVAAKYMSDIENGKRNVSIQILCRIANAFNMTLSNLIYSAEEYKISK